MRPVATTPACGSGTTFVIITAKGPFGSMRSMLLPISLSGEPCHICDILYFCASAGLGKCLTTMLSTTWCSGARFDNSSSRPLIVYSIMSLNVMPSFISFFRSSHAEKARRKKFKERVAAELNPPFSINDLVIDGNDIMRELAIEPGPKVGEILSKLFIEVDENLKLNTRSE